MLLGWRFAKWHRARRCAMRLLECAPSRSRALLALIVLTTGLVTFVYVLDVQQLHGLRAAHSGKSSRWLARTWTWSCVDQRCLRQEWMPSKPRELGKPPWSSLATCRMTCGSSPVIWPKPTGLHVLGSNSSSFVLSNLKFKVNSNMRPQTRSIILEALNIFKGNLQALASAEAQRSSEEPLGVKFDVRVILKREEDLLSLSTDESYKLLIEKISKTRLTASIIAKTFFGVRHGLETLSQVIWWDEGERGVGAFRVLENVTVEDEPRFSYRGLMVDTSRNFMSVSALKRTIEGMAVSKLNVLHLHLTDTHSFPFESTRYPQLSRYGAYSPEQVYTAKDIRELFLYARVRGVRLIPEVDVPAHAGNGWQWGVQENLGVLAVCVNKQPWRLYCGQPPCGQLNPSNNNTYHILRGIYQDLIELTNITDLFHIGGDEINRNCWIQSLDVFPDGPNSGFDEFWDKVNEFHIRALSELVTANGGVKPKAVVIWSNSDMPQDEYLRTFPPEEYVIQEWGGSNWENTINHLKLNYRVIISHVDAWYFDCGFGASSASLQEPCSPVASLEKVYFHQPWIGYPTEYLPLILGGEGCLWSEKADEHSLDSRLWPRAAALAERLWSDPPANESLWEDVFARIAMHRERLVARGVHSDVVWPQWCNANPGAC